MSGQLSLTKQNKKIEKKNDLKTYGVRRCTCSENLKRNDRDCGISISSGRDCGLNVSEIDPLSDTCSPTWSASGGQPSGNVSGNGNASGG